MPSSLFLTRVRAVPAPFSPQANALFTHLKGRIGFAIALGILAGSGYTFWWNQPSPFCFEVTMKSTRWGFAQLYYDVGSGVNESDSFRTPIEGDNRQAVYRFPLPRGMYSNLRFDPTDRPRSHITLTNARIADRAGHLVHAIPPSEIKPSHQIENFEAGDTEVSFTTPAGGNDSILALEFAEPVILGNFVKPSFRTLVRRFLISFLITAGIGFFGFHPVFRMGQGARRLIARLVAWGGTHRWQTMLLVAAASVVLSCYPIVFFGKSFLSPNNHSHTFLLYEEMPTVPGDKEVATDDEKGSDLGAAMWYTWPTSVVESRALLRDHELPLWNRYDSVGLPLLGQGQSMLGDPLHLLALLTNGSTGWWDLKYLLAKFLFAVLLGFCVLQLTKHPPTAGIIAATAPFIGFFSFRYTHPAIFSMCYAPSILLCWLKLIDATTPRAIAGWLGAMVLANWAVMNSGTVKEAYVLLLTMNLCGSLTLLLAKSVAGKTRKLRQALCAQLFFVLIATPVWLTFLNTLRRSWTIYDNGGVFQLQPSLLIGLFDDIFYRQFNSDERHLDPSANFLVLAGVLWFCVSGRKRDRMRLSWGLSITCLFALAFVFGIVPPSLILRLPFLGNIYHIDGAFSCIAIICLLVLAGFGIKAFWDDCYSSHFRRTYLRVLLCLGGLLALYFGTTQAAQRSTRTLLQFGEQIPKSNFFWGYSIVLIAALTALPWIGRHALRANRAHTGHALVLAMIFFLLHWRFGMHLVTPFDAYVMNPHQRTNLLAESSSALALIHGRGLEPSRAVGLNDNLFPGYGGAVGVEQIDSADPLLNKHYRALVDAYGARLPFGSGNQGKIEDRLGEDLPLFDMLNVRYYLGSGESKAAAFPSLKKIAELDLDVYESSKFWPRAFFSDRLTTYSSENEFALLVKHGSNTPFAATAKEEIGLHPELARVATNLDPSATTLTVPARDYSQTNNTTAFKINAPSAGVVVLTEAYVDGDLQVRVNGKPSGYFRANSAFRGVFLPNAGVYEISFSYWPDYLTFSLWLSAFAIVSFTVWLGVVSERLHLGITPRQAG